MELKDSKAFSGFSVNDIGQALQFYTEILGISVNQTDMGLHLDVTGGTPVFVYEKPNHVPADFTVLNFPVANIDDSISQLVAKGVNFERYEGLPAEQDEKGVLRGLAAGAGPDIAWFKDPAGNVFSLLQEA